ncbi:MAG: beta-1,6-N-acetylglucosaminyltransferase [Nanopusillaceae archaeon]
MKLCYIVQVHSKLDQVLWLMNFLNLDENFLILNVDNEKLFVHFKKLFEDYSNIKVRRSIPVAYCGFSQVLAWVDVFRSAIESFDFDFVINLSETDIVLRGDNEIKQILAEQYKRNKRIFMNAWKVKKEINPLMLNSFSVKNPIKPRIASLFNSRGTTIEIDPELEDLFSDVKKSPILNVPLRLSLWCEERYGQKYIYVRPLLKYEARIREFFIKKFPIFCGRVWFIFHYDALSYILTKIEELSDFVYFFSSIFEPDEEFFSTLILNDKKLIDTVSFNNFRIKGGAPLRITDEMYEDIVHDSINLFGRKLDFENSHRIRNYLEEKILKKFLLQTTLNIVRK